VTRVSSEVVFRRLRGPDGLTTVERTFIWRIERNDERDTRYVLLDADTGEILDDVWLDERGRVRSWSVETRPLPRSDAPDRGDSVRIKAVVTSTAGANHGVIEHRGDDRALAGQRQIGPSNP
jgi:hypothetical protein